MKRQLALVTLLFALVSVVVGLARAAEGADWASGIALPANETAVKLFNGRDLTGWEGQIEKYWSVDDGVVKAHNDGAVTASTYLFTKKSYRNFRLLFEMKQTRGPQFSTMHSAVAALGEKITDQGDAFSFKGPLLMFCQDWGIWDANRRNRVVPANHGGIWQNVNEKVGDWNQIEILVLGQRIRFAANGKLVFDFTDKAEMLKESPIGLQLHSNNRPQEWRFRGLVLSENPKDVLLTVEPGTQKQ